ncbi:MAG: hypothetical protein JNM00_05580, partial [Flavobacteriales bacterium]|nr:hypothetical protein [Flavobacteriales bacterium]
IDKFTFGKFEATQISGLTTVNGQRADVNPLTFRTAGGQVNSQLALTLMSDGRFSVNSMSDLSNINISQLFYEFDNFGQKTITEKHLRGAANARVHFSTPLSDDLRIDTRAMESIIDIKITNGQLIGLESLQDVAVYLRNNKWVAPFVNEDAFAEKMKDIKFSSFENLVEIKNRKIHIPAMDIRSSAMDITVKGDHSFDQAIDYTIGFNLRDVLVRKERDITEADDGLGKQIFLFMRGTTVKPEFGLDHSASKEHRREELEAEKQNVKALLKEEFGWFKRDSLTTPYHDASKVTGTTVTVEWEESPKPAEVKPEKKEVPKPAETKKKVPKWLQENEEESSPSSISVDD